jgi:hypothetical protein
VEDVTFNNHLETGNGKWAGREVVLTAASLKERTAIF